MAAAQKRSRSDEFPRWEILGFEVAGIDRIELVEERQVGARDLHIHEVVHRHSRLGQSSLQTIKHELDFIFDFRRGLPGFRVQTNPPSQIQSITGKNAVAEGRLYRLLGRIEYFARGLRHGLRKCPAHAENSCKYECYEQKTKSAIHALPPFEFF